MTQSSGATYFGWAGTWVVLGVAVLGVASALVFARYYFLLPTLFAVLIGLPYSEYRRRAGRHVAPAPV